MQTAYLRPLLTGFGLGVMLYLFAIFGLVIAFIEFLRPLLIPGINLVRLLAGSTANTVLLLVVGIALNGAIYSLLFHACSQVSQKASSPGMKRAALFSIAVVFLLVTGMAYELYLFWASPDKSWIWQVGA